MNLRIPFFTIALLWGLSPTGAFSQSTRPEGNLDNTSRPNKLALLIAIDDYAAIRDLAYCKRDMEYLSKRLVTAGFSDNNIIFMRDDAPRSELRPLKANIERALERMLATAGRNDLVLVAFSGHGVQLHGTSYLCPIEARIDDPAKTMLTVQSVNGQLKSCSARLRLLIVDACRNDPSPRGLRSIEKPTKTLDGFSRSLQSPPEGVLVLASCKPGQISVEDDEFRHGVFMHFLMRGLDGEADRKGEGNFDKQVSLLELYDYASTNTRAHVARSRNLAQTPVLYGTVTGDYDLVTALPHRPTKLPSRFYEIGESKRGDPMWYGVILKRDPMVITAGYPRVAAFLRDASEYLFGIAISGVPRVVCHRAIRASDEALRLEPDNPFGYFIRGMAHRFLGNYGEALADLQKVDIPLVLDVDFPSELTRYQEARDSRPGVSEDRSYFVVDIQTDDGGTKTVKDFDKAEVVEVRGNMLRVSAVYRILEDRTMTPLNGWVSADYVEKEVFLHTFGRPSFELGQLLSEHRLAQPTTGGYWCRKPEVVDRLKQVQGLILGGKTRTELLNSARELIADRRFAERRILMDPLRQRIPDADIERAITLCNEALQIDPGNEFVLAMRGIALRKQRDFEGALADFQKVDLPLVVNFKGNKSVPLRVGNRTTANPTDSDNLLVTRIADDWLWVESTEYRREAKPGFVRKADVE